MKRKLIAVMMLAFWLAISSLATAADPLPSWNEGKAKQSIFNFVQRVTAPESKDFVPEPERIAVFDNDGTLWAEQPFYFQLVFALDRVKALAAKHPEWQEKEPFKSALTGDLKGVLAGGEHALLELVMATHAGMTTEEFEQVVNNWIAKATTGPIPSACINRCWSCLLISAPMASRLG